MKNLIKIIGVCGLIAGFSSCDNYDDIIPQEYNKILSLKVYGEQQDVKFYNKLIYYIL